MGSTFTVDSKVTPQLVTADARQSNFVNVVISVQSMAMRSLLSVGQRMKLNFPIYVFHVIAKNFR